MILWVIVKDYTTFRHGKYFIAENLPSNIKCYYTFFLSHNWGIRSCGIPFMIFYNIFFVPIIVVVCRFYIVAELERSKWNNLMQYFFYSASLLLSHYYYLECFKVVNQIVTSFCLLLESFSHQFCQKIS